MARNSPVTKITGPWNHRFPRKSYYWHRDTLRVTLSSNGTGDQRLIPGPSAGAAPHPGANDAGGEMAPGSPARPAAVTGALGAELCRRPCFC